MSPESSPESPKSPKVPDWAQREGLKDMAWIGENLHVFVPVAQVGFEARGRGAIVVDTTRVPVKGAGNPMFYLPQTGVEARDNEDFKRMVAEYDPQTELVVILLKAKRVSAYRLHIPQLDQPGEGKTE